MWLHLHQTRLKEIYRERDDIDADISIDIDVDM